MHDSTGMEDINMEFRMDGYSSPGEGVMGWLSGMMNNKEHGVPAVKRPVVMELGILDDGLMDLHRDGAIVRRVYRAMIQKRDEKWATPKTELAIKARWTQLTSKTPEGEVYLLYKRTQKQAIAYGIPLMPIRGVALRHGTYELCLPGLCLAAYESCWQLFGDVLHTCMPDDNAEGADMGLHSSWTCWRMLVLQRPVYKGSLAKYAGVWDMHQMMVT